MSSEESAGDHGGDGIYIDASAPTSDSDPEMFSAYSRFNSHSKADGGRYTVELKSQNEDMVNNAQEEKEEINEIDLDLLPRIRGLFRLLDLISEQGVAGTVDKIIIPQDSVAKFLNEVSPKSFTSITQIDFVALDKSSVSPIGIYGSKSALISFLLKAQCIDEKVARQLEPCLPEDFNKTPSLHPGLYLLDVRHVHPGLVYVIFWPEDTTWDDNASAAVSRNREMFVRFLTKLCDQVVVLISEEHGERLAFKSRNTDSIKESVSFGHSGRLFEFEVEQTAQQEETAAASGGIKLYHPCTAQVTCGPPDFDLDRFRPTIIVGEVCQAILSVEYMAPHSKEKPISSPMQDVRFRDFLVRLRDSRIALSEDIDFETLDVLLKHGLRERYQELYNSWEEKEQTNKLNISKRESEEWLTVSNDLRNRLQKGITLWLIEIAVKIYPQFDKKVLIATLPLHSTPLALSITDLAKLEREHIREQAERNLEWIDQPGTKYSILKQRLLQHWYIIKKGLNLDFPRQQQFIDLLSLGNDYEEKLTRFFEVEKQQATGGWISRLMGKSSSSQPQAQDDRAFLERLERLRKKTPAYEPIIKTILNEAWGIIFQRIQGLAETLPEIVVAELGKIDRRNHILEQYEEESKAKLRDRIREALGNELEDGRPLVRIRRISSVKNYLKAEYHVDGEEVEAVAAGVRYQVNMLDVKAEDLQEISFNPYYIPKPSIPKPTTRSEQPPKFVLPLSHIIRFIRLLKNNRCLLVVQSTEDKLEVFLDSVHALDRAVKTSPKKTFYLHKLGSQPLFTLDETKHLLAIYSVNEGHVYITPYTFEDATNNIYPRRGSIDISQWFEVLGVPRIQHFVSLSGSEDLLLVDGTGLARIFSLVTEQFRPATRSLGSHITSVQSTPDGKAFLAIGRENDPFSLVCYHLDSFGTSPGIPVIWPSGFVPSNRIVISSLGRKEILHGFTIDQEHHSISSIALHITSRASEYAFRARVDNRIGPSNPVSFHNSIIDCHSDVWTRYPVQATIQREMAPGTTHRSRSLTFISTHHRDLFSEHFKRLVQTFEAKYHKPTQGQLGDIIIDAYPVFDPLAPAIPVSVFRVGDWVVGLFCLIPIHIAVAKQNRFVPLCNGVLSPEFEQSLLGADVAHIAESLTLGWYESILASYMSRKPIRVVTSMGEQSVGKSYCLNHLVDTSFAGSAMRCTEGVWLSVTPTREAVIVSMDFEGVNSIERSAQEDTLLVLFNAAISNLVLFRNNFALSRDIAKSFKSFQSSTKVLDPTANPTLFQSTLAIIIKDVTDFDTTEIVSEFSLKFQQIVQKEVGDNFISKLHRGKVVIIPWPVIQSPQFYELFESLKFRLMRQSTTHKSTGEFVLVLKMLMAKLKACDWGALDQNLAIQRVNHLAPSLMAALAFGVVDPDTRMEPLKNLDTGEEIPSSAPGAVFYIPEAHQNLSSASCLSALRASWTGCATRFKTSEDEFIRAFNQYLQDMANRRIQQVRTWLEQNTARFPQHANIQGLFRRFDSLTKGMKDQVTLCGMQCGSCGLLCLSERYHGGPHNCQTTHKCHRSCEFIDKHEGDSAAPICDMPAGHNGHHVCQGKPHQCGQPCRLESKTGCLHKCCKPIDHDEEEHLCAARTHACGAPCSLQAECSADGKPLCLRFCTTDCEEDHEQHCCSLALSCPAQCQLCKSFCSAGDHFHPLRTGAVHFCGQSHACRRQCEIRGICYVDTTPRSIDTTFVGKYESFQYTKYTQEAHRLPCIVSIPPNELEHPGQHIHSTALDVVHFCDVPCEFCGYYCTYPLGHPQREHSTSHGSMSNTIWCGDVEIEGRKYATGDSGAPMLCSLVCKNLRRHVHVDDCRADEDGVCGGAGVQHLDNPGTGRPQDLITHRLFWERSGFRDPYNQEEQADFDLCDHKCGGEEHDPVLNRGAIPSYCNLQLFHPPVQEGDVTSNTANGYVSRNGHAFTCRNPAQMKRALHIIFVVDRSGSMLSSDHRPLTNTPISHRLLTHHNNRYGAVLSALYAFWSSREVVTRQGAPHGARNDSYSIVLFDGTPEILLENNSTSTPDDLVGGLIGGCRYWFQGTNFDRGLATARTVLERHWDTQRTPAIIFLSDGECDVSDEVVYALCRSAVRAGSALSFHAVSFGSADKAGSLRRMVQIAEEIHDTAPQDPLPPISNPCSYSEALDTVQLANAFLEIADSLQSPRATLRRI